jgi:hypothetical protein
MNAQCTLVHLLSILGLIPRLPRHGVRLKGSSAELLREAGGFLRVALLHFHAELSDQLFGRRQPVRCGPGGARFLTKSSRHVVGFGALGGGAASGSTGGST